LDNSYDAHYAPTNVTSTISIYNIVGINNLNLAMSPNQERLKNLCEKLSGLGSELEEGK
jgi:hypothetical protein